MLSSKSNFAKKEETFSEKSFPNKKVFFGFRLTHQKLQKEKAIIMFAHWICLHIPETFVATKLGWLFRSGARRGEGWITLKSFFSGMFQNDLLDFCSKNTIWFYFIDFLNWKQEKVAGILKHTTRNFSSLPPRLIDFWCSASKSIINS